MISLDRGGIDFFATASINNFPFFDGRRLALVEGPDGAAAVWNGGAFLRAGRYGPAPSELAELVEERLGLRENYGEFLVRIPNDPIRRMDLLRGWRMRSFPLWLVLLITINQQNAGFVQGWHNLWCIIKQERPVKLGDFATYIPPELEEVLRSSELLKRRKVGYRAEHIFSAVRSIVENENPLRARGVGEYTKRIVGLLARRKYGEPPVDRRVKVVVRKAYRVDDAERFLRRGSGEWASLAVAVALDAVPPSCALERIRRGQMRPVEGASPANLWRLSPFC
ncbi:MAG: hypothetical protein JZD41_03890 [Thermoproteus sp.]|nr:hypothetical protein [Thermoproteus sp.]